MAVLIPALVVLVLLWAWVDGGRRPLREISVAVPLPAGERSGERDQ